MKVFLNSRCEQERAYASVIVHSGLCDAVYNIEEADVVVFWGCGVTPIHIDMALEELEKIAEKISGNTKLVVTGCFTNNETICNFLKSIKYIDHIAEGYGLIAAQNVKEYIANLTNQKERKNLEDIGFIVKNGTRRAEIVVQDGCSNNCAFCKTNYLNLPLKSRKIEDILDFLKSAVKNSNIDTAIICGLNPALYGKDLYGKNSLHILLQEISKIDGMENIFLECLCPQDLTFEDLEEIISNKKIKRAMIPVQSDSEEVLKIMGRKLNIFGTRSSHDLLELIRLYRPDIILETIFLNGHPGSSVADAYADCKLYSDILPENIIMSPYIDMQSTIYSPGHNLLNLTDAEKYRQYRIYSDFMLKHHFKRLKEIFTKPMEAVICGIEDGIAYCLTNYRITDKDIYIFVPVDDSFNIGDRILVTGNDMPQVIKYSGSYTLKSKFVHGHIC